MGGWRGIVAVAILVGGGVLQSAACRHRSEEPDERLAPKGAEQSPASRPSDSIDSDVDSSIGSGVTREEQSENPPGPPGAVAVSRRNDLVTVEWNGTRDDTIIGYAVYRRRGGGEWEWAGFVELHADDARNRGAYTFEERSDTARESEYTVAAVGRDGKSGPKTAETR